MNTPQSKDGKHKVLIVEMSTEELKEFVGSKEPVVHPVGGQRGNAMGNKSLSTHAPAQELREPIQEAQEPIDCGDDRCPIDPMTTEQPPAPRPKIGRNPRRQR